MDQEILSAFELRRYSFQIGLPSVGVKGQEQIKKSKVLVIGAGGKGTVALQHLVSAGVGEIGICDNDLIFEEDLTKQNLYGNIDLGKQKAIISRQKLLEINNYSRIEVYNICLTRDNIDKICKGYNILLDCTENNSSHYLINDAAIRLNLPVVYGAGKAPEITVTVFNFREGPSYRCLYPEPVRDDYKPDLNGITTNGILCSITGTIMANEALKIILNLNNILTAKLLQFNLSNYSIKFQPIKRDPENFNS